MFLIVLFPLLALGTIAAVAILSDAQHEDRWVLNDRYACCEDRAVGKQLKLNSDSTKSGSSSLEFEPANIAA